MFRCKSAKGFHLLPHLPWQCPASGLTRAGGGRPGERPSRGRRPAASRGRARAGGGRGPRLPSSPGSPRPRACRRHLRRGGQNSGQRADSEPHLAPRPWRAAAPRRRSRASCTLAPLWTVTMLSSCNKECIKHYRSWSCSSICCLLARGDTSARCTQMERHSFRTRRTIWLTLS